MFEKPPEIDIPSAIAAEIMRLDWVNVDNVDVNCDRYGDFQLAAERVLTKLNLSTKVRKD